VDDACVCEVDLRRLRKGASELVDDEDGDVVLAVDLGVRPSHRCGQHGRRPRHDPLVVLDKAHHLLDRCLLELSCVAD
jgi:hypothetical protein